MTSRGTLLTYFGALASLLVAACGSPKSTPTASAIASEEPPPPTSASSAVPVEPPPPPAPAGPGATAFTPFDDAKCAGATAEVAQYLSRGEIALATSATEIGVTWLVQQRDGAKIGVGAYDAQAKRVMRDRSVADTKEHGPRLYAGKDDWIVAWFSEDGMSFARTTKEAANRYDIGTFSMMKDVPLDDLAIAPTPDGAFVAASPFATGGKQLTVFTFSSAPTAPTKQSVGMTRNGTAPHHPVIAADADGFVLVWAEADGARSVRLDAVGKSKGGATKLLGPAARSDMAILPTATGFYLVWAEGSVIAAAALTKDGTIAAEPVKIGEGKWPRAAVSGADLVVGWVGEGEKFVVAKWTAGAAGPTAGILASPAVKDPPAIGVVGGRVAAFGTEPIPAVATKKAVLRTFEAACLP